MSRQGIPTFAGLGLTINITKTPQSRSGGSRSFSDGTKRVQYQPHVASSVKSSSSSTTVGLSKGWKPDAPKMAIDPYVGDIVKMIEKEKVCAMSLPTGSGKTRRITAEMALRGYTTRVAIPIKVAVRDSYNFIKKVTTLDTGYAYGRTSSYKSDTQIVFGTTGHFRAVLQGLIARGRSDLKASAKSILGDVFFIDEVHTASRDITTLIGLIVHIFPNLDGAPKIVFMTATLNHGDILNYFPTFPTYKVELDTYPIQIEYLINEFDPMNPSIGGSVDEKAVEVIKAELEVLTSKTVSVGIIFRPGVAEVLGMIDNLEKAFPKEPIEFYPAYSQLSDEEIDAIFAPASPGTMKVIIATNVVESSVTIPEAVWIVDDLLVKTAETSWTGGTRLALGYATQAESQQRGGRIGRTGPGRLYRLCTEQFWNKLPNFRKREIDRVPIEDIVLQLIDIKLSPVQILRISPERYADSERILLSMNMLKIENETFVLTEIGKFVAQMPLSVQNSAMIYYGMKDIMPKALDIAVQNMAHKDTKDLKPEAITATQLTELRTVLAVAAMLEIGPGQQGFFYNPRKTRGETKDEYKARMMAHTEKYHEKYRGKTDIHTLATIFWSIVVGYNVAQSYDRAHARGFTDYVKEYAIENMFNNRKVREALVVLNDLEDKVLQLIKLPEGTKPIDFRSSIPEANNYEQLGSVVVKVFIQAYGNNMLIRVPDDRPHPYYILASDKRPKPTKYSLSRGFHQIPIGRYSAPARLIAAELAEIEGEKGIYFSAGMLTDL
jgi:HrpA-like RNA helicase